MCAIHMPYWQLKIIISALLIELESSGQTPLSQEIHSLIQVMLNQIKIKSLFTCSCKVRRKLFLFCDWGACLVVMKFWQWQIKTISAVHQQSTASKYGLDAMSPPLLRTCFGQYQPPSAVHEHCSKLIQFNPHLQVYPWFNLLWAPTKPSSSTQFLTTVIYMHIAHRHTGAWCSARHHMHVYS